LKYLNATVTQQTKGVFFVHGDATQMDKLAADINFVRVFTPEKGQVFDLGTL
jgi:hypothetical protein